ncbi:MAG: hypothetical protein JXR64_00175 [Spirochaetales bacterium]|nr:hypothetical protein [Spirochaetales bacterium]
MINKKAILTILIITLLGLSSCSNELHNGTEMVVSQVTVTGLPSSTYPEGQQMVLSHYDGTVWGHDGDRFTDSTFIGTVTAEGTLTYNFSPALEITTPEFSFLLIDPDKTWDSLKIDTKHSGLSGGDIELENLWTGSLNPVVVEGVVDGDSVTWGYKD